MHNMFFLPVQYVLLLFGVKKSRYVVENPTNFMLMVDPSLSERNLGRFCVCFQLRSVKGWIGFPLAPGHSAKVTCWSGENVTP